MRYLNERFHYRVSGIDYVPAAADLEQILRVDSIDVGTVRVADVRAVDPEPRFDLVASFGFIEHFNDPEEMLRLHTRWLAPQGWLVVEVPHFRRVQWALHRLFDVRSLRGHNLEAMNRGMIRRTLTALGLDIHFLDYVGVCGFWFEPDERGPLRDRTARAARTVFGKADSALSRAPVDLANPLTSPYLLCVAQRH
jgi:SAM-dependent methyltransferase